MKHGNHSPDLAPRIHPQISKRIKLLDMTGPEKLEGEFSVKSVMFCLNLPAAGQEETLALNSS